MKLGESRRVLWSHRIPSKVASSPSLFGRRLYVSAYDRRIYSFDGWSGRLRWQTTAFSDDAEVRVLLGLRSLVRRKSWTEGGYYATPAVAYDRMYAGVIDGVFSAFDARTGVHRWSRRLAGSIYGSAAVWKEKVFVGTTAGTFYALSARGGDVLWTQELGGKILGSPTVTNGRVYIATTRRETFALNARDRRGRVALRRRALFAARRCRIARVPHRQGTHLRAAERPTRARAARGALADARTRLAIRLESARGGRGSLHGVRLCERGRPEVLR